MDGLRTLTPDVEPLSPQHRQETTESPAKSQTSFRLVVMLKRRFTNNYRTPPIAPTTSLNSGTITSAPHAPTPCAASLLPTTTSTSSALIVAG
eukprot:CAMPEP_0183553238 /NCGR_PEP_ID=MMETSP0371-20130417/73500_1 /TAXON_ID=268820 /ORGANISM="Peridinium aciculiferum, Strain PAER-2" /LENGTH=92 /DNA_ID=CAMNT_0025758547 /DNA_START=161 /DNA_END=439 /DNA_ORIENTATION=+